MERTNPLAVGYTFIGACSNPQDFEQVHRLYIVTPIRADNLAGDKARFFRSQIKAGVGDVLRLTDSAQRCPLKEVIHHFIDLLLRPLHGFKDGGFDDAWGNRIHGDPMRGHLFRQCLGETDQGRFGGRLMDGSFLPIGRYGADVDNPAPLALHHRTDHPRVQLRAPRTWTANIRSQSRESIQ